MTVAAFARLLFELQGHFLSRSGTPKQMPWGMRTGTLFFKVPVQCLTACLLNLPGLHFEFLRQLFSATASAERDRVGRKQGREEEREGERASEREQKAE